MKEHKAKQIAAKWHSGQWSALYQFSSSGFYQANILRYVWEVKQCMLPEFFSVYPQELTKKDKNELQNLMRYFIERSRVKIEWTKHPNYGYPVPYAENVNPINIPL